MEYKNIYEDFYYETSAQTLNYTIYDGDVAIYFGEAVKSPSADRLRVNVAQRVRDYLANNMPDFRPLSGSVVEHPDACKQFDLVGGNGAILASYKVLLDYDEPYVGTDMILSDPVNIKIDPRMKLFWSGEFVSAGTVEVKIGVLRPSIQIYFDSVLDFLASSVTVDYTSNTDFTLASVSADWLTVTQEKDGETGGTLTVTYGANYSDEDRYATVCLTALNIFDEVVRYCFTVVQKAFEVPTSGPYTEYFTMEVVSSGTLSVWYIQDSILPISFSKDSGATWETADVNSGARICNIPLTAGEVILFKGNYLNIQQDAIMFNCTTKNSLLVNVRGNVLSLLYGDGFATSSRVIGTRAFESLFLSTINDDYGFIISAEDLYLPSTEVPDYAYCNMFAGQDKLTKPPVIFARLVGDYAMENMFLDCRSLTSTPDLSNVVRVGIFGLGYSFSGCTELTAVTELNATELYDFSYINMFGRCAKIKKTPVLPATTVPRYAYQNMFTRCTSLEEVREIKAEVVYDFGLSDMFTNCTSLTGISQESLYVNTFVGTEGNNLHGMFAGCTSLEKAPELPATSGLGVACYTAMFSGCTSLEESPVLPAITLSAYAYSFMFIGCTSLKKITCYAVYTTATNCTRRWVENVGANGTFIANSETYWTSGVNDAPSGWQVEYVHV